MPGNNSKNVFVHWADVDKMRTMQGIKFYEPEVVGDTPEAVEYLGMQNLLTAVKEHVGYRHGKLIFSADGQVGFVTLLKAERDAQQQRRCRFLAASLNIVLPVHFVAVVKAPVDHAALRLIYSEASTDGQQPSCFSCKIICANCRKWQTFFISLLTSQPK